MIEEKYRFINIAIATVIYNYTRNSLSKMNINIIFGMRNTLLILFLYVDIHVYTLIYHVLEPYT